MTLKEDKDHDWPAQNMAETLEMLVKHKSKNCGKNWFGLSH